MSTHPWLQFLAPLPFLGDDSETHDSKFCNSSSVCIFLAGSAVNVAFLHVSEGEQKGINGF